ncbi:11313_t:CDS:1, partial [Paraglomus occultum]
EGVSVETSCVGAACLQFISYVEEWCLSSINRIDISSWSRGQIDKSEVRRENI